MRAIQGIVESQTAPSTNVIWINKGIAKYFSNGEWIEIGKSITIDDIKPDLDSINLYKNYKQIGGTKSVTDFIKAIKELIDDKPWEKLQQEHS